MVTNPLQKEALRIAKSEYERGIVEETPNWSPRLEEYWQNLDPPVDISDPEFNPPWCASFVQWCTDRAAENLDRTNPLNGVAREAYVPDYWQWALDNKLYLVEGAIMLPGDLIVFSFGGKRFDHIGFYEKKLEGYRVFTVEGNTSPGVGTSDREKEREGDGVYRKIRSLDRWNTQLVRWGG